MRRHGISPLVFVLAGLLFLHGCSKADQKEHHWDVSSPSGSIEVEVAHLSASSDEQNDPNAGKLHYRVFYNGRVIIDWSPLGLQYAGVNLADGLTVLDGTLTPFRDDYVLMHGKQHEISVTANRLRVSAQNADAAKIHIDFHVQNDGISFRYVVPEQDALAASGTVTEEYSGFKIEEGSKAWMHKQHAAGKWTPAYETFFYKMPVGTNETDFDTGQTQNYEETFSGWSIPALFETKESGAYILLTEAGLDDGYAGTRFASAVNDNLYSIEFPSQDEGMGQGSALPEVTLPLQTPWRVAMIGDLKTIVESTFVTDVSQPLDDLFNDENPDWVRPGRAAWDWWHYQKTGDLARQKRFVDGASEFGWEYVLVDANWNFWKGDDPYDQLAELVRYAEERNVEILLWYNSGGPNNEVTEGPRDRMYPARRRQEEMAKISALGIKGIKVDFWHSDKRQHIQQYLDLLRDAAKYKLMVNFHGSTMTRGWERRFPNMMTMESVKGGEAYQWDQGPKAWDNVSYVFTRNVVGPMDYTPVTFEQAFVDHQISYGHSLAEAVVFQSGLQHFADVVDLPDAGYRRVFARFPFVKEYMRHVPATWDETLLLGGDINTHAIVARRSGRDWYVSALSSVETPHNLLVNFDFLAEGVSYTVELIRDGEDPESLIYEKMNLSKASAQKIKLLANGGFSFKIVAGK